jgi:hypothetical protein
MSKWNVRAKKRPRRAGTPRFFGISPQRYVRRANAAFVVKKMSDATHAVMASQRSELAVAREMLQPVNKVT